MTLDLIEFDMDSSVLKSLLNRTKAKLQSRIHIESGYSCEFSGAFHILVLNSAILLNLIWFFFYFAFYFSCFQVCSLSLVSGCPWFTFYFAFFAFCLLFIVLLFILLLILIWFSFFFSFSFVFSFFVSKCALSLSGEWLPMFHPAVEALKGAGERGRMRGDYRRGGWGP